MGTAAKVEMMKAMKECMPDKEEGEDDADANDEDDNSADDKVEAEAKWGLFSRYAYYPAVFYRSEEVDADKVAFKNCVDALLPEMEPEEQQCMDEVKAAMQE